MIRTAPIFLRWLDAFLSKPLSRLLSTSVQGYVANANSFFFFDPGIAVRIGIFDLGCVPGIKGPGLPDLFTQLLNPPFCVSNGRRNNIGSVSRLLSVTRASIGSRWSKSRGTVVLASQLGDAAQKHQFLTSFRTKGAKPPARPRKGTREGESTMHPFFSVSLYTGQQLLLAGLQRWVFDPYKRLEHRRQRASLRALIILLVKTAATGVLAALLDAAIEYRTRQLVALAQEEDQTEGSAPSLSSPSRLAALGMLSRGGVAAWKSRLLQAIDEMERRAQLYGLSSSRSSGMVGEYSKEEEGTATLDEGYLPSHAPSDSDTRGFLVRQTIQQLQELMRRGGSDEESHEQVEQRVDRLLDNLLGPHEVEGEDPCPEKKCSELLSDARPIASPEGCPICMDASMRVCVSGCGHGLCFGCARQLCNTREHMLPACPFCRRPIEGFELCST